MEPGEVVELVPQAARKAHREEAVQVEILQGLMERKVKQVAVYLEALTLEVELIQLAP